VPTSASIKEIESAIGQRRSIWVIDEEGKPVGWVDKASLSEAVTAREAIVTLDMSEIAIMSGATLREVLSRMLGQGFKSIPVVDEDMHLIGEVTLSDVEAATAETEA